MLKIKSIKRVYIFAFIDYISSRIIVELSIMHVENPLITHWLSDKNNRPLFMEMINGVIATSNYDLALNLVNQAPMTLWDDVQFIKIDLLLAMQAFDKALEALRQISNTSDNQQRYNYYIAKIFFLQGKLDDALVHLGRDVSTLNVDGILLKARTEYLSGALDAAARTMCSLNIDYSPQALGLAAMVALDSGNYSDAETLSTRALQLHSSQPDALLAKASLLLMQQNSNGADGYIKPFLSLLPSSGRGWSVQGQISMLQQDLNKSLSEFQTAVRFMPEHIGTWHLLAWNFYLLGFLDNAEQAFTESLNIDDAFADTYGGLAVIAAAKNQVELAQKHIKYAFRLSKYSFSAEYAKALLEEARGESDIAIKRIRDLLAQNSHLDNISYRQLIDNLIKPRIDE